ncbi:MAG: SDR family oxidoreductase [Gammaproteobacteria bacterium]|nr:SDR family oxidoreductase [Gammaproteobacteria bacterium]MCH9762716.1 SDR family oxidoreductase [Gammaproteobacteria bacterium]
MLNLSNKVILVTGASSGIGREVALLASSLGASVILTGRNEPELQAILSKISNEDAEHCAIPFDLVNFENFDELLVKISSFSKKIDGVVHCAGMSITEPLRFTSIESVNQLIDLNLKATIHLIAGLRKKRIFNVNASVLLLSSLAGIRSEPAIATYAASKAAIISLTKSFATELVFPDRIRVNCLAPGIVETELVKNEFKALSPDSVKSLSKKYPLGFGQVRDIANAAVYFLSDASSWVTGSCLLIDGGRSLELG